MPQKKLMMIQRTLETPPMSVRLTMLITHSTKAMGCRKIAIRTSTRNLNIGLVSRLGRGLDQRPERARDARPASRRGKGAVRRLLIRGLEPPPSHARDGVGEAVDLRVGVVRRQAGA